MESTRKYVPTVTLLEVLDGDNEMPSPLISHTPFLMPSGRRVYLSWRGGLCFCIRHDRGTEYRAVSTWEEARQIRRQYPTAELGRVSVRYETGACKHGIPAHDLRIEVSYLEKQPLKADDLPGLVIERNYEPHPLVMAAFVSAEDLRNPDRVLPNGKAFSETVHIATQAELDELQRLIRRYEKAGQVFRQCRQDIERWWAERKTLAAVLEELETKDSCCA